MTFGCAAAGCSTLADDFIAQIPVCLKHRAQMITEIGSAEYRNVVYYVTWQESGLVKIGTTRDVNSRMKNLGAAGLGIRVGRPRLLVVEPGGYTLEAERHRQFADLRVPHEGAELFRFGDPLFAHIRQLKRDYPNWRAIANAATSTGIAAVEIAS